MFILIHFNNILNLLTLIYNKINLYKYKQIIIIKIAITLIK